MNAKNRYFLKLLCLLAILGQTTVHAAAPFDPDTQPIGYVGQPGVSSAVVTSGSERIYAIEYNNLFWSGNMHSYPLSSVGAVILADDWNSGAAPAIDAQNFSSRYIVTTKGSMTVPLPSGEQIPFSWSSTSGLTNAQKGVLDSATATAAVSSPVLNYIRGQRTNEKPNGAQYRARSSVLGDIIHSTPVYWNDGTNETVFIGANDGMLHALDATDGKERFAYIPSVLISKLSALRVDPYVHKYFVDGQMSIRPFTIGGSPKTILAGALGSGGKGLFALDVTNAAATSEANAATKILWEVTNSTPLFANLGHTYGQPVLATVPSGVAAVIVGNGYNNTGNGQASLFVINANTGEWIAEISTGSGSLASPNGLSSPKLLDVDLDGRADFAYAGDIDGNLWKFNLSANTKTLLHTTSPAQAITMAPGLSVHPTGGHMLTFATGRMFTSADSVDNATHFAYGIWDRPSTHAANNTILAQTLAETTYTSGATSIRVRTASNNVPDWTAGAGKHMGWKTPLPIGGERVVGDGAFVSNSAFTFLSSNPTISPAATPPGENWDMQLNAITGGDNGTIRFDLNGDGALTSSDQLTGSVNPVGRHFGGAVRSQFILLSAAGIDVLQASIDLNGIPAIPPTTLTSGVSNGHFDFDIFYPACKALFTSTVNSVSYTYLQKCVHKHEYDDTYNVTGVNMLNASLTSFNLSNAIPSTSTQFKVLVSNQAYSPAAKFSIGVPGAVGSMVDQPVITYGVAPGLTMASLPTHTRADVSATNPATKFNLVYNLPQDAFTSKDWGTGVVRAGLHPTETSCMNKNPPRFFAPENAWRNGALTFQIVKANTPDSAIELNVVGKPELGYRVKPTPTAMANLLAEYVTFWHHPTNGCYGDSGWVPNPAQDFSASSATPTVPAAGSADPQGVFGASTGGGSTTTGGTSGTGGAGGSVGGAVSTVVLNASGGTTTTTTFPPVVSTLNGIQKTITITEAKTVYPTETCITTTTVTENKVLATGVTTSSTQVVGPICIKNREIAPAEVLGRVNWRELLQ